MPMDFAENEEQSMIREMVRGFAEDVLSPSTLERDREQRAPLDEWNHSVNMAFRESQFRRNMGVALWTISPRQ